MSKMGWVDFPFKQTDNFITTTITNVLCENNIRYKKLALSQSIRARILIQENVETSHGLICLLCAV